MRPFRATLILLAALWSGASLSPAFAANERAAEYAVRSFYEWYVPQTMAADHEPAARTLLRTKPETLTPGLRRQLTVALKRERHASSRGISAGLDVDPFLGSQDPCPRFKVLKTRFEQPRYLVDVKAICGAGSPQRVITVSLVRTKGRMLINDVSYGNGNSLRSALRQMAAG